MDCDVNQNPVIQEEPEEIRGGTVVHRVDGEVIFASQCYRILRSRDQGKTWQEDGAVPVPGWREAVEAFSLLRRVSRGGVARIWPLADGTRLAVVPKRIMRAQAGSSRYECVFHLARGSRPLSLCQGKDGKIYWGEYFLNLRRSEPVHIFVFQRTEGKHGRCVHLSEGRSAMFIESCTIPFGSLSLSAREIASTRSPS